MLIALLTATIIISLSFTAKAQDLFAFPDSTSKMLNLLHGIPEATVSTSTQFSIGVTNRLDGTYVVSRRPYGLLQVCLVHLEWLESFVLTHLDRN